jgi:hypothetical protein
VHQCLSRKDGTTIWCGSGSGADCEERRVVFGEAHALGQDYAEAVKKRGLSGVGLGDATQSDLPCVAVGRTTSWDWMRASSSRIAPASCRGPRAAATSQGKPFRVFPILAAEILRYCKCLTCIQTSMHYDPTIFITRWGHGDNRHACTEYPACNYAENCPSFQHYGLRAANVMVPNGLCLR